mgnify:CR=1 FL=1
MPTINKLPRADEISGGDLLAIYLQNMGGAYAVALTTLLDWLQEQLTAAGGFIQQYASPAATAFSVEIDADEGQNIWLILTPLGAYADGEIVLPPVANCVNGQEISVNTTQAVTTFVVDPNDGAVLGAPATLAQFAKFTLRYNAVNETWYCVG